MVRVDSQKHIDFSLTSPFGGGRPGRVKRKAMARWVPGRLGRGGWLQLAVGWAVAAG
jgi:hypothetical protein